MAALVVLDFSGTLSLEAVRFSEPDRLTKALHEAGLWALGVDSLNLFWEEIINPTWPEGSTTQIGYTRLIYQRLQRMPSTLEVFAAKHPVERDALLQDHALAFTRQYFSASIIDPSWHPCLVQLTQDPNFHLLIATDHYAEATQHICLELQNFGLTGRPALEAQTNPVDGTSASTTIWIANSADLGSLKASSAFWVKVKDCLSLSQLDRLFVIDDFGANEQGADMYAENAKVQRRMKQTQELLATQFNVEPTIFQFNLSGQYSLSAYRLLVKQATEFIENSTD